VASSDAPRATSQAPGTSSGTPQASAEITRPGHRDGIPADEASRQMKRTIWSGVLAGFGLAAFLDETFFHQILHWHHFYDKSTMAVGLLSDGLFHVFGSTSIVAGLFLMADSLRRGWLHPQTLVGRAAAGSGGLSAL
jgi:uncharacterized membrane protein